MTSIEELIPHRPPFRFVDEVVALYDDAGEFALTLAPDDHRLTAGSLAPLFLVEALAQSAAAFHGARGQAEGAIQETGLLVQVAGASFSRSARGGDRVSLYIERQRQLGALVQLHGRALVGEETIVAAQLTVARSV